MGCGGSKGATEAQPAAAQKPVGGGKPAAGKKDPLLFRTKPNAAIGDASIPEKRRVRFGIVMPESTGVAAVHVYCDKEKEVGKLLAAAASAGGFAIDKGKLVGSPEKLNLFTLDGDVIRLDLEVEAHLGSTLHADDILILEKGNRVFDSRLAAIKAKHGR
jgi:hypothetical protein